MTPEIDHGGRINVNPVEIARKCVTSFSRVNGGWVKALSGIDDSRQDGYSLVGQFCADRPGWYLPGVFLDCSRNEKKWFYTVFIIYPDGRGEEIPPAEEAEGPGGPWAVNLWNRVKIGMETLKEGTTPAVVKRAIMDNLIRQLIKEAGGKAAAKYLIDQY